jgi:hypothetical protein
VRKAGGEFPQSKGNKMSLEEVMRNSGFNLSASCAGKASYTKWIKYQGKRAYITVNDAGGDSFPTTLDEPVRVTIHDLKSGNELEPPRDISSLSSYLASLEE